MMRVVGQVPTWVEECVSKNLASMGLDFAWGPPADPHAEHIALTAAAAADLHRSLVPTVSWQGMEGLFASSDNCARVAREVRGRAAVFAGLRSLTSRLVPREFHLTLRVNDLAASTRFYAWLLGVTPKLWSSHHSVLVSPSAGINLVLIAAKATEGGRTNVAHLGVAVDSAAALLEAHRAALQHGIVVVKGPETTWSGTPLHQLWLRDPDGHDVELYARLSAAELALEPADGRPQSLL